MHPEERRRIANSRAAVLSIDVFFFRSGFVKIEKELPLGSKR